MDLFLITDIILQAARRRAQQGCGAGTDRGAAAALRRSAKRAHRRGGAPARDGAGHGGRAARNSRPRGAVLGTQLCGEHAAGLSAARGRPPARPVRHGGRRKRQRHGRAADFLAQSARGAAN